MKELDLALGDENVVHDDDDDMSTYMAGSEASETTAVTGNVSSVSSTMMKHEVVTPENSPGKGRGKKGSEPQGVNGNDIQSDETTITTTTRDESSPRGLVMCGAVGVNDELKGSIQDVNDTLSQIFATVRRFGPDEKNAVRETFKDARYYMKEKVRAALLLRKNDGNRSDNISPKKRGSTRELNDSSRSIVHEVRRRERMMMQAEEIEEVGDESEEVVYDNSSGPYGEPTRMLV